jgi:hypothetical protein
MIKLYTAFTEEIDDPAIAAEEILAQLNPAANMRADTVGMIFFSAEFAENDILLRFAELMPFPLIGCVSNYTGASGAYGDFAVSVTMLTGDDVRFRVDIIEGMDVKSTDELQTEFNNLCIELHRHEKPRLIMPFIPPYAHFSIDNLLHSMFSVENPALFFGPTAFNLDGIPGTNYVTGKGRVSGGLCAYLTFYGEVEPKFYITCSYDMDEISGEEVTVTDYSIASLKTVNDIPVLEYLQNKGVISESGNCGAGITAIPAAISYTYGLKAACALLGVEEDGSILTARSLEVGAKIAFSHLDDSRTLQGIKDLIYNVEFNKHSEFIAFSGAARAWAFGANYLTELEEFAKCPLTYAVAYSGAEICPIPHDGCAYEDGSPLRNMVHNYTMVACSFC